MAICSLCGEETNNDSNMCENCKKGFDDKSMINCKICGKLTNEKYICLDCLQEYQPKLKEFFDKYPGLTYLEAVFHKQLPVKRNILYEFSQAGIIKIK